MLILCQDCRQVAELFNLNVEKLLKDLAKSKGDLKGKAMQPLSNKEKFFLCLSLQGYEALDIARIEIQRELHFSDNLHERAKNIRKELSAKLNEYVKALINRSPDEHIRQELAEKSRMLNWLRVLSFLLENGYRQTQPAHQVTLEVKYQGSANFQQLNKLLLTASQEFRDGELDVIDLDGVSHVE